MMIYRPDKRAPAPSIPSDRGYKLSIFVSWFDKIFNWIFERSFYFIEPEISREYDRNGNLWWRVRNRATGEMAWLETEDEVRAWLERPDQNFGN